MGNRSYLIINKPGKPQEILFEGNNSLAHFWLLLLEKQDIENVRGTYREAYQPGDEDAEIDTDIKIDKDRALENVGRRRYYIAQAYPELLSYFDEWVAYLGKQPTTDNILFIDLVQVAGFYKSPDEFLDSLLEFYGKVAQGQPAFEKTLSDTSGWDGTGDESFATVSPGYRGFPQVDSFSPIGAQAKTPGRIKALNYTWGAVSLLMVAGLFYLFGLFPHFWQHLLIALLFVPVIFISIRGFLLVEKWSKQPVRKAEGE
ncbi:hypothetical protein [Chitinophaga barathri]|uniref:Uncharacterized protein n=1 Tax=Chitinophaga barathri TaxID=1647451 RepID=A0A3N4MHB2_9BACT|nr:hypothetical protein [Chitinophaga barathri]RPD43281.1 hypothetical protein EG028_03005 [Chitinophaga barathri]